MITRVYFSDMLSSHQASPKVLKQVLLMTQVLSNPLQPRKEGVVKTNTALVRLC